MSQIPVWGPPPLLNPPVAAVGTEPPGCDAVAYEQAFCSLRPWMHHHRCNMTHTDGPGNIPMHHCDCGATFYFIDDALKAIIEAVFGENPNS